MRSKFTFACLALFCVAAAGDVIRLKNGKSIVADSVQESDGRIEYTIGDNAFSIPESLVERIDAGPVEKHLVPAPELPPVHLQVEAEPELSARVIHGGHIDTAALKAVEDEGIADKSAAANFIAAVFEEKQDHLAGASRYLQAGLTYQPDSAVLLEHYAGVLLRLGRNAEAISYAERATRAEPQSADAFLVLGYAYYQNNRNRDAIAAWKKSLELHPDETVQQLLKKAERESAAESDFREQETSHFVLRYEGAQAPDPLRKEIIRVLEAQYGALQNDLGSAPRGSVPVSLYTEQAFFDVTQAPAWTSALNDGKIRVPVSGLTAMTPALERVLRHELTHSFVAQITHDRAPAWLDEGLAQLEEPKSISAVGKRLAALYASGNQIPLNQLEHSFQSYGAAEAAVAYAESLAATEFIQSNYGISDLARILQRLGEGEPIESALRNTVHSGYAQFEVDLAEYLKRTYGQ
ncbi:MAG TPA: tetratricopeptide repeat protein [Candidatus Angelobacter sp.]